MYVVRTLFVESGARLTFVACLAFGGGVHAVDGLGKNTGTSSLAYASRSAEEVSMCQFAGGNGIFQSSGQSPLSNYRLEGRRTVLAG